MRLISVLLAGVLAGQPSTQVVSQQPSGLAVVEAINGEVALPVKEKAARISVEWNRYYAASDLGRMGDNALADALLATNIAVFYLTVAGDTNVEPFVSRLQEIHAALAARGAASALQTEKVFDQLVALRRFEEARQLQVGHPTLAGREIPKVRFAVGFDARAPATMTLSPDGAYDVRNEPVLESRAVILIGCERSAKAVEAIVAEPALLRELEGANVLWLTAAAPGIGTAHVEAWNARFPRQAMRVAWSNAPWAGLDIGAMPTFHYLKQGRVSERHVGWDPAQTPATIRAALARLRTGTGEGGASPSP